MSQATETDVNELVDNGDSSSAQAEDNEGQRDESSGRIDDLPPWAVEMIRELREESKARRIALRQREDQDREAEQRRLAETGQWQTLAEERLTEIESLARYRERAEMLEARIRESNEQRVARIPEQWRSVVPTDYTPEALASWLDLNLTRLTRPVAPSLDGGASAGTSQVTLTDEEKQIARKAGMTLDDYASAKARMRG